MMRAILVCIFFWQIYILKKGNIETGPLGNLIKYPGVECSNLQKNNSLDIHLQYVYQLVMGFTQKFPTMCVK